MASSKFDAVSQKFEQDGDPAAIETARPNVQNLRQLFQADTVTSDEAKGLPSPKPRTSRHVDNIPEENDINDKSNVRPEINLDRRKLGARRNLLSEPQTIDSKLTELSTNLPSAKPALPVKPKLPVKPRVNSEQCSPKIKSQPDQVKCMTVDESPAKSEALASSDKNVHNDSVSVGSDEVIAVSERVKSFGGVTSIQKSVPARPYAPPPSPNHHIVGGVSYAIVNKKRSDLQKSEGSSLPISESPRTINKRGGKVTQNAFDGTVGKKEPRDETDSKVTRDKERLPYDGVLLLPKDKDHTRQAFAYDGIVPLSDTSHAKNKPSKTDSPATEAPPTKPPRTFAHDVYIESKVKKNIEQDKSSVDRTGKPRPVSGSGRINLYEEIPESGILKSGLNRPSTRPPPPPRPPLPNRNVKLRRELSICVSNKNDPMRLNPYSRIVQPKSDLPKDAFITPKRGLVRNPNYERDSDILRITTKIKPQYLDDMEKEAINDNAKMKRSNSDEFLYADPRIMKIAPNYFEPSSRHYPQVELDTFGYAIPSVLPPSNVTRNYRRSGSLNEEENASKKPQRQGSVTMPKNMKFKSNTNKKTSQAAHLDQCVRKKKPSVREKISAAYSILRRRQMLEETAAEAGFEIIDADSIGEDNESLVDMAEHKKRMNYVNVVRELQQETMKRCRQVQERAYMQLFEYFLVVALMRKGKKYEPYVRSRFPDQIADENKNIPQFCFPDAETWQPVTHYTSESFSFVLTAVDGSKQYGYCRRILPPGSDNRLPEVFCIISPLAAFGFYFKVLDEVEKCRHLSMEQVHEFIKAAFGRPLPAPGKSATIQILTDAGGIEKIELHRQADSRLENVNFDVLTSCLDTDNLIQVFASLLLEKRIIFTAKTLSTLSSCIHAIISLLYPFTWQHTFIPVLPSGLLDICCCPTPYVIGLLTPNVPLLQDLPMEEVLVIDLDENQLIDAEGTEDTIIPHKLCKALQMSLTEDSDMNVSSNVIVTEAFLRLFIETVGHYSEFFSTQQDGQKIFQKDLFIKAVSSKSIRCFLEWLTETQMFEVFITERLKDTPQKGLFETRITEYREEMAEETRSFRSKVKELGKKMINLGGKIKKAFTPNVYV